MIIALSIKAPPSPIAHIDLYLANCIDRVRHSRIAVKLSCAPYIQFPYKPGQLFGNYIDLVLLLYNKSFITFTAMP